ncbi:hypothetical protein GCK32_021281, partial [Trichostrongylus colubriformis]
PSPNGYIFIQIWTRRNVWVMVGLQYVVAFIAVSPLIGAEIVYTPNTDGTYTFAGLETQADLVSLLMRNCNSEGPGRRRKRNYKRT